MWENSPNNGGEELTHGKRLQKKKEETLSKDIGKERSANFPPSLLQSESQDQAAGPVHNLAGTRPPLHSHLLVPVPQQGGREALKSGALSHWRRPGPSRRGSGPHGPGTPNPGPQRRSNLTTPTTRPPRASGGRSAPPLLPRRGGHAPPRQLSVRGSPLRTPVSCRGLPQPPCRGTATKGLLPESGWGGESR